MTRYDNAYEAALRTERSSRDIAKEFGLNKSTVTKHRALRGIVSAAKNQHTTPAILKRSGNPDVDTVSEKPEDRTVSSEFSTDGSFSTDWIRSRAVTLEDAEDWVRSSGHDPEDYNISVRTIAYGEQWSNRMAATPKQSKQGRTPLPTDELLALIENWHPKVTVKKGYSKKTFVVSAADFQIGKTDYGYTTEDTIKRILTSFTLAAEFAQKHQFEEIVLTDLGDILENWTSTSSQRGTNDRALTEQIRIARRIMLEAIKMLSPLTPKLTYLAVPSNHGSVRVGFKSSENHVLDDYGIEIAEQLRDVCSNSDKLSNVQVLIPDTSMESLAYTTQDGTKLGLVHGHQANGPTALGKWWAGQDHGRMPTAGADILLVGHYHSLRVEHSGDARWIFVAPTSDNGSSWWSNKTGQTSKQGILTFTVESGQWDDLRIL